MSHRTSPLDRRVTELLAMGFTVIPKTRNMYERNTVTGYHEVATLNTAPSGFVTCSITASRIGAQHPLPSHAKRW